MGEPLVVWVAYWYINWYDFPPSFGVVGVTESQQDAFDLLAENMVDQHAAKLLPRTNYPNPYAWLDAIARTSSPNAYLCLADADIEFFVHHCQVLPDSAGSPAD